MDVLFFIELPKYGGLDQTSMLNWYRQDQQGVTTGCNTLKTLTEHIGHCHCIAVLPGTQVYQAQSSLTIRNRKQLAQALQYDLEEQLAEEVENLQIAYQKNREKTLDIVVINKVILQDYLHALTAANITVTTLITDTQLLANCPQKSLLLYIDDYTLLKIGQHCIATESQGLPIILESLVDALPESIPVYGHSTLIMVDCPMRLEPQTLSTPLFNFLCQQFSHAPLLNLLQGEFQSHAPKTWRTLQWLGAGLGIIFLVLNLYQFYQNKQLQNQENQLEQAIIAIYKTSFPQARRIIAPIAQMRTGLRAAQAQQGNHSGFIALLAALARSHSQQLVIHGMQYQQHKLSIDVSAHSLAQLEILTNTLQQQGIKADISTVNKANNRVHAQLQLTGES